MSAIKLDLDAHQRRVVNIATLLVAGMIERGEIEDTDEAIQAAMPRAVADARAIVNAAEEFISG